MKKVTFAILGMGNRGTAYAAKILKYSEESQVTAMADNRRIRLDSANKYVQLPEDRLFSGAEDLLAQPKLADVMIIATQDAQHKEHAIRAMEIGYDLLLEKPISNTLEDITAIYRRAKELGRKVIVCHVLRYTPFYRTAKKLLTEGAVGKICSIEASEHVGYYHYAHSFVRGNWHSKEASSPMILAKCCHDMDILCWLADKHCEKLSSFGSLRYFKEENSPEGAAQRCADCSLDCPFHAQRFYLSRIPGWPANVLQPEPTEENILQTLDVTDYGKCVFRMDNDVVDHQSINMLLEDEVTVTFQMLGFTNRQTRYLRVFGTEGELWGNFEERKLYVQRFNQERQEYDLNKLGFDFSGHGGGDEGLIYDVIRVMRGDDFDTTSVTFLENSVESHYMAFAAEDSRLQGGRVTDMKEFAANV
ncbi:MAG: Gfo/Idh/MocA family oxidoreductase [Oscillospiraceae bacterium]|nr:Gfo/Idh/MocA family oxidoreductase [Oscillospiraceae bacterium]